MIISLKKPIHVSLMILRYKKKTNANNETNTKRQNTQSQKKRIEPRKCGNKKITKKKTTATRTTTTTTTTTEQEKCRNLTRNVFSHPYLYDSRQRILREHEGDLVDVEGVLECLVKPGVDGVVVGRKMRKHVAANLRVRV